MNQNPQLAPTDFFGILKQLGPGLIISASIVGSGELIVTTKLGADVGFTLLWFILIGCMVKVFVQLELGRFAITSGKTTLEMLNLIPGPRVIVSWILWAWLIMYVATVLQVAGIVGGISQVFSTAGFAWPEWAWAIVTTGSCALLLGLGRYRLVENFSTFMVAAFTLCTLVAVVSLAWTPWAITPAQWAQGFSFRLPADFNVAFAAFGIIGVGASELIYYPYWCLEKGYGRKVGPRDDSPEWNQRAKSWIHVMTIDAWVSMAIYTLATLSFYLLGAAILHGKDLVVENANLVTTLSHMYRETLGNWGFVIFLFGAFMVLYSTVFIATASNARLFADASHLWGLVDFKKDGDRERLTRLACIGLPLACLIFYLLIKQPVTLVLIGGVAQGLMLPLLALSSIYFYYVKLPRALRPANLIWLPLLWIASALMVLAGLYQVYKQFN